MDQLNKPSFSANTNTTSSDTQETKTFRPEIGAIWEKKSREKSNPFMSIRFRMSKEKLQELINSSEAGEDGLVNINFVAFPNKGKVEGDKRPNHRIYEEQEKPSNT
jgi:uncharacterized protein (DUF736 family)